MNESARFDDLLERIRGEAIRVWGEGTEVLYEPKRGPGHQPRAHSVKITLPPEPLEGVKVTAYEKSEDAVPPGRSLLDVVLADLRAMTK
jgi:hypothetical protein